MLIVILLASIFFFGLAIGSFLNVVIYRTLHGESPLKGRSKCPKCNRQIKAIDNIPLVSYIILGGRCRNCKKKISWSYPVVELLTGVLFVWWILAGAVFFRLTGFPLIIIQPLFWLTVGLLFIVLFFTDLLQGVLPDLLVGILVVLAFFYRLYLTLFGIMQIKDFWSYILSGFLAFIFFLALIIVTKGKGMGMGDVKLSFGLGLILGWPKVIVAMFLAFILGAGVATILLLSRKRKFGQTIPFGPFLILSSLLTLVWGDKLVSYYISLLL